MARPTTVVRGELAQVIMGLRAEYGETQQAFSNRLGIALNTVQRWELNETPSLEMLLRLIDLAYGRKRRDLCRVMVKELTRDYGSIRQMLRVEWQ
jgi:transcriptional regulator with XRE-family HTH domain